MAANVLTNHNQNPYGGYKQRRQTVQFAAGEYEIGTLSLLTPISLRVLLVMAAQLTNEGFVVAPLDMVASRTNCSRSFVNKGILELARFGLITKKKRGQYWMDPSYFRPVVIEV